MTNWWSGDLSVWKLGLHTVQDGLAQISLVGPSSYAHTLLHAAYFLVIFIGLAVPGLAAWHWLTNKAPEWRDVPAISAIVLLFLFLWEYANVATHLPGVLFWAGIAAWALVGWFKGGYSQLRRLLPRLKPRYIVLVVLVCVSALVWIRPTFVTGQYDAQQNNLFVSSGERLLFLGYDEAVARSIPPQHPYWAGFPLSYHYFGMVEQVAWQRFGLDPLLLNYLFLPFLMALVIGGLVSSLALSLSKSRAVWWLAPLIFFWWDSASAVLPASLHYPGSTRWWLSPYQGHSHVYMNGPSHYFGTVFLLLLWYLAAFLFAPGTRRRWLAVLIGVAAGSLILFKVQTFLIVAVLGGLLAAVELVRAAYFRRITLGIRVIAICAVAFLVTAGIFFFNNRMVLVEGGPGNLSLRPFQEVIGLELNPLPVLHAWYGHVTGLDYHRLDDPTGYLTNWRTVEVLLLFALLSIAATFFVKLVGFGAPLGKERMPRFLGNTMKAGAAVGILLLYSLYVGGSNQWQFLYPTVALLSVLTAVALASWPGSLLWVILFSLVSVPASIGMVAMFSERNLTQIPTAYLSTVLSMVPLAEQENATCLFLLPDDSTGGNSQPLELILPFYAHCLAAGTFGPQTIVNTRPLDIGQISIFWNQYSQAKDPQAILQVLSALKPTYIWVAPHNRYGLSDAQLGATSWNRRSTDPKGGSVWVLSPTAQRGLGWKAARPGQSLKE